MARYERDPQIGEFLLRGWLAGQSLGQRRREFNDEIAFQRDREQRYVQQMEWQRQQAEAAQAQELARQAASQNILQGLFPQQPQQQFQDPGVKGLMGGMQQSGMLPPSPQQPPDLRQLLGEYGAMADPFVVRAATETLQAKEQQRAEESARQYQAQRLVAEATKIDKQINAMEALLNKAGDNPNDVLQPQIAPRLEALYRRRAGYQASIDSLVNGVPAATLMSSYDDVFQQQQQQQERPSLSQISGVINTRLEAEVGPLIQQRKFLQDQLEGAVREAGGFNSSLLTRSFASPTGEVMQGFTLVRLLGELDQAIAAKQGQAAQQLGGLVQGQMPVQPQQPIGAPPQQQAAPLSLPDLIAQIDAQHPDWTDEQVMLYIQQNHPNIGN